MNLKYLCSFTFSSFLFLYYFLLFCFFFNYCHLNFVIFIRRVCISRRWILRFYKNSSESVSLSMIFSSFILGFRSRNLICYFSLFSGSGTFCGSISLIATKVLLKSECKLEIFKKISGKVIIIRFLWPI